MKGHIFADQEVAMKESLVTVMSAMEVSYNGIVKSAKEVLKEMRMKMVFCSEMDAPRNIYRFRY